MQDQYFQNSLLPSVNNRTILLPIYLADMTFPKVLLSFIRPCVKKIYKIYDQRGM